jgi:hypothetical protein
VQRGGLFLFALDKGDERFPSLVSVGRAPASTRPAKDDNGTSGTTPSNPGSGDDGKSGNEPGNPPA